MDVVFNKLIVELKCANYRLSGAEKRWYAEQVEANVVVEGGYRGLSSDDLEELRLNLEEVVNQFLTVMHINQCAGLAEDGEIIINSITPKVIECLKLTVVNPADESDDITGEDN